MTKKRVLNFIMIGCTSLCLIIVFIFFNPIALVSNVVRVNRIKTELSPAETRWQSSQIIEYEMDVEGFVPLLCFYNAHLVVRQGELSSVQVREGLFEDNSPLRALAPANWERQLGCSYSGLTVESMFDRVRESLDIDVFETFLKVNFDSQYGYVTEYEIRYGYLTGGVSECCTWFKIRNLHPITKK